MNKAISLFTIIGFKITWLSCIFGELYLNSSLIGFFIGLIYLTFFFYFNVKKYRAFIICFLFSLLGYFFDSMLIYFKLYEINADKYFLFLPIWFIVLWPSFSTLFVNVLSFLENKTLLSFSLGAIVGPLTYYSGTTVGLANTNNHYICFISIAIFWGLLLYCFSSYIKKEKIIYQPH